MSNPFAAPAFRALVLGAALWASACGPIDPDVRAATIVELKGDAAAGKTLFETRTRRACATCHGVDGVGGGHYPNIHPASTGFSTTALALQILEGKREMPPFASFLSDDEIADIIAYLRATFGTSVPP